MVVVVVVVAFVANVIVKVCVDIVFNVYVMVLSFSFLTVFVAWCYYLVLLRLVFVLLLMFLMCGGC